MPRRKYLDNTIPSDNTAQIGIRQRYNANADIERRYQNAYRREKAGISSKMRKSSVRRHQGIGFDDKWFVNARNPMSYQRWANKSRGVIQPTSPEFDLLTMLPARYLAGAYANTLVNATRKLGNDFIIPAAKGSVNYIKNHPEQVFKVARMKPFRPITRRAIETAMRTTSAPNPLSDIKYGFDLIRHSPDAIPRLFDIGNYILTGIRNPFRKKGWYNSLAINPDDYYSGFWHLPERFGEPRGHGSYGNDYIDAALYNKTIDPAFGYKKVAKGKDFGEYADIIKKEYSDKAPNIVTYETTLPKRYRQMSEPKEYDYVSKNNDMYASDDYMANVAGHNAYYNRPKTFLDPVIKRESDIWHFLQKGYDKKWEPKRINRFHPNSELADRWVDGGLKLVQDFVTPVIARTPWYVRRIRYRTPYLEQVQGYKRDVIRDVLLGKKLDPIKGKDLDIDLPF